MGEKWSQWSGLNRRPTVYETVALPLSYTGLCRVVRDRTRRRESSIRPNARVARRFFGSANFAMHREVGDDGSNEMGVRARSPGFSRRNVRHVESAQSPTAPSVGGCRTTGRRDSLPRFPCPTTASSEVLRRLPSFEPREGHVQAAHVSIQGGRHVRGQDPVSPLGIKRPEDPQVLWIAGGKPRDAAEPTGPGRQTPPVHPPAPGSGGRPASVPSGCPETCPLPPTSRTPWPGSGCPGRRRLPS